MKVSDLRAALEGVPGDLDVLIVATDGQGGYALDWVEAAGADVLPERQRIASDGDIQPAGTRYFRIGDLPE